MFISLGSILNWFTHLESNLYWEIIRSIDYTFISGSNNFPRHCCMFRTVVRFAQILPFDFVLKVIKSNEAIHNDVFINWIKQKKNVKFLSTNHSIFLRNYSQLLINRNRGENNRFWTQNIGSNSAYGNIILFYRLEH